MDRSQMEMVRRIDAQVAEKTGLTRQGYIDSAESLLSFAESAGSGSGKAAASVVLSCEFNLAYKVSTIDLCKFDHTRLNLACDMLKGRALYGPPADLIENGYNRLAALRDQWPSLAPDDDE